VRDSTGIITAKILAEIDAGNPKADIFLGTSATSLLVVDSKGMLLPYPNSSGTGFLTVSSWL
jgi:iron(III) transport system substrate-binding protein